jgi:hypothetical protein
LTWFKHISDKSLEKRKLQNWAEGCIQKQSNLKRNFIVIFIMPVLPKQKAGLDGALMGLVKHGLA